LNQKEGARPMPTFSARVISKSRDGRRAEVVTHIGEGSLRRSITRHVRLRSGQFIGLNPDDAALSRLNEAETGLTNAQARYDLVKSLAKLKAKELGRILAGPAEDAPRGLRGILKDVPEDQRNTPKKVQAILKEELAEATSFLGEARKLAKKVAGEIPRHVIYS